MCDHFRFCGGDRPTRLVEYAMCVKYGEQFRKTAHGDALARYLCALDDVKKSDDAEKVKDDDQK